MNARDALEVARQAVSEGRYERDRVDPLNTHEWQREADEAIATLSALVDQAGEPVAVEYRLWDSQWVNVVNHDDCYGGYDMDDAIAKAVRLTEEAMRWNAERNSWPPAKTLQPAAPGASHD